MLFHVLCNVKEFNKLETCDVKKKKNLLGGIDCFWCVVLSFPLSGPASDHQLSVEENETSYSGKVNRRHRRHTHSQDTLCHTHNKISEYKKATMQVCETAYASRIYVPSVFTMYLIDKFSASMDISLLLSSLNAVGSFLVNRVTNDKVQLQLRISFLRCVVIQQASIVTVEGPHTLAQMPGLCEIISKHMMPLMCLDIQLSWEGGVKSFQEVKILSQGFP